jgi:hypothetical protein
MKKLENLRIEVAPSEEETDNRLSYKLLLPVLDISAAASAPQPPADTKADNPP